MTKQGFRVFMALLLVAVIGAGAGIYFGLFHDKVMAGIEQQPESVEAPAAEAQAFNAAVPVVNAKAGAGYDSSEGMYDITLMLDFDGEDNFTCKFPVSIGSYSGFYVAEGIQTDAQKILENDVAYLLYMAGQKIEEEQVYLTTYNLSSRYESGRLKYDTDYSIVGLVIDDSEPGIVARYGTVATFRRSQPVALPENPVKEGYRFEGWYYDAEFTRPYDGKPIYADTELFAKWRIETYTVWFDVVGGNGLPARRVEYNTTLSDLPTPERYGYRFVCWMLGDTPYTDQPVTSDIRLTAKWELVTLTVTFIVDGETYHTVTVGYGATLKDAVKALAETTGFAPAFNEIKDYAGNVVNLDDPVTYNTILSVVEKTGWDYFASWVKEYWWACLVIIISAVILIVTLVAIVRRKRS